ncbi:MAG: exonuclease SbcCD subunit D [Thermoplasmata archaeon]
MRFAHIADCHLGAFRDIRLREINLNAFNTALDQCLEKNVDFIIIAGDLFDGASPDMSILNAAVKKIKHVREAGIPIYLIYGSHDFVANETSIIDVLGSAGLFSKVVKSSYNENQQIKMEFTTDKKTGAKIVGLSGRRGGLDEKYYQQLDFSHLEKEDGFKIFVFHNAIAEFKPAHLSEMASIPFSYLPKGFNYYAGGHVHERFEKRTANNSMLVFPGALFGADSRDLEYNETHERGFYIVDFKNNMIETEFCHIDMCKVTTIKYDANNKTPIEINLELNKLAADSDVQNKIVLLKVSGRLGSGKVSEIKLGAISEKIMGMGAVTVQINRASLTAREIPVTRVIGTTREEIEQNLFVEYLAEYEKNVRQEDKTLYGVSGAKLWKELTEQLKEKRDEKKKEYEDIIRKRVCKILGIEI